MSLPDNATPLSGRKRGREEEPSWRGRTRTRSGDSPGSPTNGGLRAKPRALGRARTVRFRSDSPSKQLA